VKIDDIFNIQTGYLKSRIKNEVNSQLTAVYSKQHFDYDLSYDDLEHEIDLSYIKLDKDKYFTLSNGDIVVDSLSLKAAVVSKINEGMFIAFNYFVLKPKVDYPVDLNSFVGYFNLNENIRRQLDKVLHGSVIKKLTMTQLKEIELNENIIYNPQIGILYMESQKKVNYAKKIHDNELDIIRHAMEVVENYAG